MKNSIAPTTGTSAGPLGLPAPSGTSRAFKPQTHWKSVLDAAAPLTPAEWLDREIRLLAATGWASAAAAIAEALLIAGDLANDYATAAAAERLSQLRLPDRPQRNAHLPALTTAGGPR